MDFFDELDFLSIIEEEQEETDISLGGEIEDRQINENDQLMEVCENFQNDEKRSSKPPVSIERNSLGNDEQYIPEQQICSSTENKSDKSYENDIGFKLNDDEIREFQNIYYSSSPVNDTGELTRNTDGDMSIEIVKEYAQLENWSSTILKESSEQINQETSIKTSYTSVESSPLDEGAKAYGVCNDRIRKNVEHLNKDTSDQSLFFIGPEIPIDKADSSELYSEIKNRVQLEAISDEKWIGKFQDGSRKDDWSQSESRDSKTVGREEKEIPFLESSFGASNQCRKSNPDIHFPTDMKRSDESNEINHKTLSRHDFPTPETETSVKNSGNEVDSSWEDIDFLAVVESFLLSELKESSDNFTFYSLDPEGTPLACQESDEPILEAPVEFRTVPEGSNGEAWAQTQVPPPAPLRVPEEEPPSRDHHNTGLSETGDTIQRSRPAGELVLEEAGESARKEPVDGTASVLASNANSTEDNDHVELEGDNRNAIAFEHVGMDAPIQRHDMLQIDRRERGETVETLESSSIAESCPSQCQIDRGRGSDVFSSESVGETYDRSRRENCASDLCLVSAKNDNPFPLDMLTRRCECGSLNIPDSLLSDSASTADSSVSSVRKFSIEEYWDEVPEMFSDRYKFKFSTVVGDTFGSEEKLGLQDSNNNVSRLQHGLCNGNFCDQKGSSADLAATSAPSTPASFAAEERRPRDPADAHLGESRSSKPLSSIHAESSVPAPAPGCSPTKTAAPKGCVRSRQALLPGCTSSTPEDGDPADVDARDSATSANVREPRNLRWSFKNGRLVFDSESDVNDNKDVAPGKTSQEVNLDSIESGELKLTSKEVNKKIDENKSRLRYLEEKLKKAGISDETKKEIDSLETDVSKQVVEASELGKEGAVSDEGLNVSEINGDNVEEYAEGLTSFTGGEEFCQFDVSQIGSFPAVLNGYCLVYDELNQSTDSEEEFHVISFEEDAELEEQFYLLSTNRKKLSAKMGTDSERPKHNPDSDNLKSLLKRPGRNRDKKSNRVVFNEKKNEFFDADYIILIREECDYDDEDDDSVCTCNQHEMVRLTCCEPNCNCSVYEGYDPTPQSPKFAPPLEFVDAVTLSPPEGYKDMELEEQELFALQQIARRGQQRHAVCRECSATHDNHDEDGDSSQSDDNGGPHSDLDEHGEREKTDQSQQTTPTTPENCTDESNLHDFSLDRPPMTASERAYSSDEERREERPAPSTRLNVPAGGSPISGILKGGKLWKQPSLDGGTEGNISNKTPELQQNTDSSATSDEEGSQRRFVRFIESENNGQRDCCDGASDDHSQEESSKHQSTENDRTKQENCHNNVCPDTTEMMLTFKLGNHVLISNNSLKPNSAVRQLFPCTKTSSGKDEESIQQYLVTAESLRAFEEAKRSKLPQMIQSGETDESIKKAIERNTLRRSLIRYEPRSRKNQPKTDNSLVERIKQLTCDVDDVQVEQEATDAQIRASPPGEEARNSTEVTTLKQQDKSFSPSSSSTSSSNASSVSSTYKKITDLFTKKASEKPLDNQNNVVGNATQETKITPTLPDLGNGPHEMDHAHVPASRINSSTNESRKQFLASLAPLTACVSGITNIDDYYYQMNNHANHGGERASVASSVGTEYSLEDIDEALRNDQEETKRITPDVLAGTPSASESGDELAMFVQQDAGRIERIKKKYQAESNKEEDDEHDDYGFNKRPSVRGIKPRFGTTTQIIQEIQNQMQPPEAAGRISWPYYSESGLSNVDNTKSRNSNQNIPHQYSVPEEFKTRGYPPTYRPTSLPEENMYQSGQYCRQVYRTNGNPNSNPNVMKVGARCNDVYQSLPRQKSGGRPLSPPPSEVSRTYHQTMVYIPYNHIEGCQGGVSSNVYYQHSDYARVSNQNQINKRYIDPIYQQRFHMHVEDHHYHYNSSVMTSNPPKQMIRIPYPQPHCANRSESPMPGQYSTAARATQTPVPNCNYYSNPRYRPVVGPAWQGDPAYVSKMNRHSFPMGPRYSTSDTSTDTDSGQGVPLPQNGYRQSMDLSFPSQKEVLGNSPTKPKFTERGVPEGAASVSPPDTIKIGQSNSSTMTSPTSPQNVTMPSQKPMFYAMNV